MIFKNKNNISSKRERWDEREIVQSIAFQRSYLFQSSFKISHNLSFHIKKLNHLTDEVITDHYNTFKKNCVCVCDRERERIEYRASIAFERLYLQKYLSTYLYIKKLKHLTDHNYPLQHFHLKKKKDRRERNKIFEIVETYAFGT